MFVRYLVNSMPNQAHRLVSPSTCWSPLL